MGNRKMMLDLLQRTHDRYKQLQNVVEKATDQELENILDNYFSEFGTNIQVNIYFMEMIVTRIDHRHCFG